MDYKSIHKLMEIQYLKGRLDELYKGYVPNSNSSNNRYVDSRISKYETKLKEIDEIAYHLYEVERTNVKFSKDKSKRDMKELLSEIMDVMNTSPLTPDVLTLIDKIKLQILKYD